MYSRFFNPALLPEIDLVAKGQEATDQDPDRAANIAKAIAVLDHQWTVTNHQRVISKKLIKGHVK